MQSVGWGIGIPQPRLWCRKSPERVLTTIPAPTKAVRQIIIALQKQVFAFQREIILAGKADYPFKGMASLRPQ